MRSTLSRALAGALLLGLTACGTPAQPTETESAAAVAPDAAHGGHGGGQNPDGSGGTHHVPTLYAVQTAPLGPVLTDGNGHFIYRSDADSASPPTSNCTGPCAETWIPVLVPDQDFELAGVKAELVGRVQRPDGGAQLTIAGWPVYYNRDDDGLLASTGQNGADGVWFVVTPKGEKAAPA